MWCWRYRLRPTRTLNARAGVGPRSGALIRMDGGGVADVHPWPELGDLPTEVQLEKLARNELTPLTRRSLEFAKLDADARERGVSLFEGLTIPPSHWPAGVTEAPACSPAGPAASRAAVPNGFDTIKIKMRHGDVVPSELAAYKLRLDFNATLDADAFIAFANALPSQIRSAIDFVEDPCPYDASTWSRVRRATGLRLALDRGDEGEGVDVLVVKPALQELPRATTKELVITSYMDHPVGQLCAALVAATNRERVSTCGLVTHVLYHPDAFIERMRIDGNRLVPPDGTGIGFDDLLEKLPWKKLA